MEQQIFEREIMIKQSESKSTINWRKNLIFVSVSQFLAMIGFGCCMPFIPLYLRESFGILDDQQRGLYVSIFSFAGITSLCVATAVWGMLADKFGRKIMLLRASYGAAIFYPLLVFAPNFWWMAAVRFICSFFSGTVNPAQTLLVCTTPPKKHGLVLGVISAAIWCGDMIGYMGGGIVVHYFGFRAAFISCGLIYLLSGLLVHLFVKENFQRPAVPKAKKAEKRSRWQLLTPGVVWILAMVLVMGVARRIETPFIAMQVELISGIDKAAFYTGITSAVAALGGIFSGIFIGHVCDRMLPRKLLLPILLVSSGTTLAQAFSGNIETLIIARFFTYFAAGGLQPVLQVMLTKITDPERRGTFFGWFGSINVAGGIISSVLSGGIAYCGGVRGIFITSGILFLLMIPMIYPTVRASKSEYVCSPDATARDLRKRKS